MKKNQKYYKKMFSQNIKPTKKTLEQIKFDTQLLKDFIRVEGLLRKKCS